MRVETFPQADIAALQALPASLDAAVIGGVAIGLAPLNAPVLGASEGLSQPESGRGQKLPAEVRKPQSDSIGPQALMIQS